MYLPVLRRVREIMPIGAYEDFLGTDFTYGDLDLVNLPDRKSQFLGMEKHAGMWAYKVQEIPQQPWYYSRIISWVAADSFLPLERDYYAPSKKLWRIERFGEIKRINGVPTPLGIRMEDLQGGSSSTIAVSDVCYDTNVPDTLFDPARLSEAVASPVWSYLAWPPRLWVRAKDKLFDDCARRQDCNAPASLTAYGQTLPVRTP